MSVAGVQRQYTGTAGRVENAQVAVYLTYAVPGGHALIDRDLYLPRSWTRDPARCGAAGIPAGTAFATKPALAQRMIARALDAGTPASWAAADEAYGADPGLRACLETRRIGYVLAVAVSHLVTTRPATCGRARWPPSCRRGPGSGYRPGQAPRASAGMTGPGSASSPASPGTGGC